MDGKAYWESDNLIYIGKTKKTNRQTNTENCIYYYAVKEQDGTANKIELACLIGKTSLIFSMKSSLNRISEKTRISIGLIAEKMEKEIRQSKEISFVERFGAMSKDPSRYERRNAETLDEKFDKQLAAWIEESKAEPSGQSPFPIKGILFYGIDGVRTGKLLEKLEFGKLTKDFSRGGVEHECEAELDLEGKNSSAAAYIVKKLQEKGYDCYLSVPHLD